MGNQNVMTKEEALAKWRNGTANYVRAVKKRLWWDKPYRLALRRSAGKTLEDADAKTVAEFYKVHPFRRYGKLCFLVATIQSMWPIPVPDRVPVPLEQIPRKIPAPATFKKQLGQLLYTPDFDAYFAMQLYRLAYIAKHEKIEIDCIMLLRMLITFQKNTGTVRRKWLAEQ